MKIKFRLAILFALTLLTVQILYLNHNNQDLLIYNAKNERKYNDPISSDNNFNYTSFSGLNQSFTTKIVDYGISTFYYRSNITCKVEFKENLMSFHFQYFVYFFNSSEMTIENTTHNVFGSNCIGLIFQIKLCSPEMINVGWIMFDNLNFSNPVSLLNTTSQKNLTIECFKHPIYYDYDILMYYEDSIDFFGNYDNYNSEISYIGEKLPFHHIGRSSTRKSAIYVRNFSRFAFEIKFFFEQFSIDFSINGSHIANFLTSRSANSSINCSYQFKCTKYEDFPFPFNLKVGTQHWFDHDRGSSGTTKSSMIYSHEFDSDISVLRTYSGVVFETMKNNNITGAHPEIEIEYIPTGLTQIPINYSFKFYEYKEEIIASNKIHGIHIGLFLIIGISSIIALHKRIIDKNEISLK